MSNYYYLTSSTNAGSPFYAWYVSMFGIVDEYDKSNYNAIYRGYVWPVRGGQYWPFGSLIISASPKFGTTPVGSTPTPRQIEIGNRGGAVLAVRSIAVSGTNYSEFPISPSLHHPLHSPMYGFLQPGF